uniref:SFRICE_004589 n=1 Tax=Spodoptera frugiperda TaxID=7108 RepID=A0A2H1WM20_SPOFR
MIDEETNHYKISTVYSIRHIEISLHLGKYVHVHEPIQSSSQCLCQGCVCAAARVQMTSHCCNVHVFTIALLFCHPGTIVLLSREILSYKTCPMTNRSRAEWVKSVQDKLFIKTKMCYATLLCDAFGFQAHILVV